MSRRSKHPVKSLPEMKSVQKLRASKRAAKTTEPVEHFKRYSANLALLMRDYDWSPVAELGGDLAQAIKTRAQLFICGNGGSAGNATHLANDFLYGVAKHPGAALRVISLAANPAVLTCLANDEGYDRIYDLQLRELAQKGDILLVFSGSGNSPNILKALEAAKEMGVKSYAVLGYSGGKARTMCDVPIHFEIDDMQVAEDMQLIIGHMLMQWLWENRTAISGIPADKSGKK
jgi:D-sedoheptulose 7-phosphate isomerase